MFTHTQISIATISDIPALESLLNGAYRGETSQQGWTTEAHLIEGDTRTDEQTLQQLMQQEGSVFLKYAIGTNDIVGCVNLQVEGKKVYLGMLSVNPLLQGGGVGKKLLQAAEEFARQQGCSSIYMSVISVRSELIDWYIRHGYKDTGERKPFYEDGIAGKHLQQMEFMILEKKEIFHKDAKEPQSR